MNNGIYRKDGETSLDASAPFPIIAVTAIFNNKFLSQLLAFSIASCILVIFSLPIV